MTSLKQELVAEKHRAVSRGRCYTQWLLLILVLPVLGLLFWWPSLLMVDGQALSHGLLMLLMMGLCLALLVGSGLFQYCQSWLWYLVNALAYLFVLSAWFIIF